MVSTASIFMALDSVCTALLIEVEIEKLLPPGHLLFLRRNRKNVVDMLCMIHVHVFY